MVLLDLDEAELVFRLVFRLVLRFGLGGCIGAGGIEVWDLLAVFLALDGDFSGVPSILAGPFPFDVLIVGELLDAVVGGVEAGSLGGGDALGFEELVGDFVAERFHEGDIGECPGVEFGGLDSGDVVAQRAVGSRALETNEDSKG